MNPHAGFSRTALSQAPRYSPPNSIRWSGPDMGRSLLTRLAIVVVGIGVGIAVGVVVGIVVGVVVRTGRGTRTSRHVPAALLRLRLRLRLRPRLRLRLRPWLRGHRAAHAPGWSGPGRGVRATSVIGSTSVV